MNNRLPPTPPLDASTLAISIRKPGEFMGSSAVIFQGLEKAVQRHLFLHQLPSMTEKADRFLVVSGEPGSAKSVTVCDAALRFGWAIAHLPVDSLSGESEGAANAVLNDFLASVVKASLALQLPIAVIGDDLDLSILAATGTDDKMGYTVNALLLAKAFQGLADAPKQYRNFNSTVIPLIFTGNDFTTLRASLFRSKRAKHVPHDVSFAEKLHFAFHLLAPKTADELRLVEKVVKTYRHEPIAFWPGLLNDLQSDRLDDLMGIVLAQKSPDFAAADAQMAQRVPLNPDRLWAHAKARATKTRSYL